MIYIVAPSVTPRLERCALDAIERTTPEPHRVLVSRGRTHAENLDAAYAGLPPDAEWLFVQDDDAAPLRLGWLSWLIRIAEFWEVNAVTFGPSRVVGALYRVSALRRLPGVSFVQPPGRNPGGGIDVGRVAPIRRVFDGPWWLKNCEAYRDDDGELVFAHLGGGTIGHTRRLGWRLYPRIPVWLWPWMVDRHLKRQWLYPGSDRKYQQACSRCGRIVYHYGMRPAVCSTCETAEEQAAHRAQMERARQVQAVEESQ